MKILSKNRVRSNDQQNGHEFNSIYIYINMLLDMLLEKQIKK